MNCNAPTNVTCTCTNDMCAGKQAANDYPLVDKEINGTDSAMFQVAGYADDVDLAAASASASVTNTSYATTGSIDPQTTNATAAVGQHTSLFFSQEASSIFDRALEMHAAPTDDPPMWGDELEDFSLRDVTEMLEDMDDLSTAGNNAVGQSGFYSPPTFKSRESFGSILGGPHDSHLGINHNYEESKGSIGRRTSDNNGAALNDHSDLPLHIMNMDKRIFECDMFLEDITQGDSNPMDHISDSRDAFVNAFPDMLNSKDRSPDGDTRTEPSAIRTFPPGKQGSINTPAPKSGLQKSPEAFQVVTPGTLNSSCILKVGPGPVPKIFLRQRSNGSSNSCNHEKKAAATNTQANKVQQDHHSRMMSKSDVAWKRRFTELEEFKRQHSHCNVQQKYEKNHSLGAWVARQRLIMRHWEDQNEGSRSSSDIDGKSLSTSERVQLLRSIGLESSVGKGALGKLCSRNTNEWEKQFADLLKYCDANGNCNVPTKCTTLGRWVSNQRKKYRKFLADEGSSRDDQDQEAFGWGKELRNRFQRLKDAGFKFHLGKGNAPIKPKSK